MINMDYVDNIEDIPQVDNTFDYSDWGSVLIERKTGLKQSVIIVTDDYIVRTNDCLVLVNQASGTKTVTLPLGYPGKQFTVKALTANTVTVDGGDYDIDGSGTASLASQYDYITVTFYEDAWHIIATSL